MSSLLPLVDDAGRELKAAPKTGVEIEHIVDWLDHHKLLGLITPEGVRAVEQLIEDLR
jgi:hypothetical protein